MSQIALGNALLIAVGATFGSLLIAVMVWRALRARLSL